MTSAPPPQPPELEISLEKLCYIVIKAREFDVKVEPLELDDGSNPGDDEEREVLEDNPGDPTRQELFDAIDGLNVDEQIELVAMTWLGRGDYEASEWKQALAAAREAHNARTAAYLIGTPNLGDELEEGMAALGLSCEEVEMNHL
ncbi:MAG TPA: DUF3775 domain-containing protein [Hypericibacter adhaerens]|jgi:hypothetical protein|uniref:DUF3775 domain-containing protein n=1 Tax=Hypericibacter adhaerens TaxID=2602016 RepID=A0A5J6MYR2_9PROT|nr:DUF3775 domain-containing protein [Hypericibacter adhaerens]QEX22878.1 hypothetical protein FRZ61_28120 [Hypericibacter adhaerens]HWA44027.1 DUF3775 domain-containing protein [Hypericibacter adhaerens]